jgi:tRNA (adenine57-N1/adenine58-N1)-methyltransferase
MLASHSEKRISFNRSIRYGDLVIVYERHDNMKAVTVSEGSVVQNRFGVFKHSDWIGKPFGSKVFSSKGGFVYLLAPTPELWTLVLSHRTQILYIADISFVIMYLEIVPGCLVLESGTGSGSLTTSLARAVAPTGHVYTFDFHEQRAASAR